MPQHVVVHHVHHQRRRRPLKPAVAVQQLPQRSERERDGAVGRAVIGLAVLGLLGSIFGGSSRRG